VDPAKVDNHRHRRDSNRQRRCWPVDFTREPPHARCDDALALAAELARLRDRDGSSAA
jgi:hypothetical protein